MFTVPTCDPNGPLLERLHSLWISSLWLLLYVEKGSPYEIAGSQQWSLILLFSVAGGVLFNC